MVFVKVVIGSTVFEVVQVALPELSLQVKVEKDSLKFEVADWLQVAVM